MLLAKSKPERSLEDHINDCITVLDELRKALPAYDDIFRDIDFWGDLRTAIIFHDLGKAHVEFQKVLLNEPNNWSYRRHEMYSLPFVRGLSLSSERKKLITHIVIGHHKNFSYLNKLFQRNYRRWAGYTYDESTSGAYDDFERSIDLDEVGTILNKFKSAWAEPVLDVPWLEINKYLKEDFNYLHPHYWCHMLGFGLFKHCDHLGSSMVTQIPILYPADFHFLDNLQRDLVKKGKDLYPHQKEASCIKGNVILTSPTGSGKTETAMLWLRNQLNKGYHGRVFYVLPFTASINAMYERLNSKIPEEKVGMMHGKLSDYLNHYFEGLQYSVEEKQESIKNLRDKFQKLITPLKVVTPFQLLKHVYGVKGYEKGIAEWPGACFIFDEIHAYDPTTFAQLMVLLKLVTRQLRARVFIMTATFPTFMKAMIKEAISDHHSITATPEVYRLFNRHKVNLLPGKLFEHISLIEEHLLLDKGNSKPAKRVLVVCNTVAEAQQVFNLLKHNQPSVLLHSAFSGEDRMEKEKRLKNDDVRLLVGTQAIEVSLDIDFDILFTEPAPLDALLQRFGRVNRKVQKGICTCYVFQNRNEVDSYIYSDAIVERTLKVFKHIQEAQAGLIKESRLQDYINQVYPKWEKKDEEEYNFIFTKFSDAVAGIRPYMDSDHAEEEYEKRFDGIKILPVSLHEEFKRRVEKRDFIHAEALKVSIRKNNFAYWLSNGTLWKETLAIAKGDDEDKLINIEYFVTSKAYNNILGLQRDKDEPTNDIQDQII